MRKLRQSLGYRSQIIIFGPMQSDYGKHQHVQLTILLLAALIHDTRTSINKLSRF